MLEIPEASPSFVPSSLTALADGTVVILVGAPDGPAGPMESALAVRPDGSVVELARVAARPGRTITALPDGGALLCGGMLADGDADDDTDLVVRIPPPSPVP